jgi:hypothetical protein
MAYFLVRYNRRTGESQVDEYGGDRARAMNARFELERVHRSDQDMEFAVLASNSRESIEQTHPRYFRSVHELATGGI